MDAFSSLLVLLRDNPSAVSGFVAGLIAAILVNVVTWRWTIRRRRHPPNGNGE